MAINSRKTDFHSEGRFFVSRIFSSGNMPYKYSQNLRDRLIAYFEKYHALTISDEQADEYLDSLAGLFIAFSEMRPKPDFALGQKRRGRIS